MRSFATLFAGVALASAQTLTGPPVVYQTDAAIPAVTATTVIPTPSAVVKRDATTCLPQPTGIGHISNPDDAATFVADTYYSSAALAAGTPSGFSSVFTNTGASPNADQYMGFTLLNTYDVAQCGAQCAAIDGCKFFNIYFERDPSVDPNDDSCSNPPSTTQIKCVWWGKLVSTDLNVNAGQWRNQFQVVIAGSNGYLANTAASSTAAPASTTLATVIKAASTTATATSTATPFNIQLGYSYTAADNKYISVNSAGVVSFVASKSAATLFNYDSAGKLINVATGLAAKIGSTTGAWQTVGFTAVGQKSLVYASCYNNAQYVSCNIGNAFQFAGVCNNDGKLYFGLPNKNPAGCKWIGMYPKY